MLICNSWNAVSLPANFNHWHSVAHYPRYAVVFLLAEFHQDTQFVISASAVLFSLWQSLFRTCSKCWRWCWRCMPTVQSRLRIWHSSHICCCRSYGHEMAIFLRLFDYSRPMSVVVFDKLRRTNWQAFISIFYIRQFVEFPLVFNKFCCQLFKALRVLENVPLEFTVLVEFWCLFLPNVSSAKCDNGYDLVLPSICHVDFNKTKELSIHLLIESHVRSVEWGHIQWHWVTPTPT